MKALILLSLVTLFALAPAWAQGNVPLGISIRPLHDTVVNAQTLSVSTKIQNLRKDDQHVQIWFCSYDFQWKPDTPSVQVEQVPCNKNYLQDIVLKAGQVYERELSVRVTVDGQELKRGSATFRLGFQPGVEELGLHGLEEPRKSPPFIWSNAVTVSVTTSLP